MLLGKTQCLSLHMCIDEWILMNGEYLFKGESVPPGYFHVGLHFMTRLLGSKFGFDLS